MRAAFRAVAAAVLLGVAAAGCARDEATGAGMVRRSALAAFPKRSVALLVLEVRPLRALPAFDRFVKEFSTAAGEETLLRGLSERLGPETFGLVERVSLAIVPQSDNRVGYAIVAEGRFDAKALGTRLGDREVLTVLEIEGRPDFSVTLLGGGGLAFGPRQILDEMRANAGRARAGLAADAALVDLLRRVRAGSEIWGAIDFRTIARIAPQPGVMEPPGSTALRDNPVASTLVGLAFQGRLVEAPEFDVTGHADDEAGARKLADAARGLVALGRMGVTQEQAADWVAFLDGIRIEQKGPDVLLHARVPPALLSAMAEKARAAALPAGASGPPAASGPRTAPSPGRAPSRSGAAGSSGTLPSGS